MFAIPGEELVFASAVISRPVLRPHDPALAGICVQRSCLGPVLVHNPCLGSNP